MTQSIKRKIKELARDVPDGHVCGDALEAAGLERINADIVDDGGVLEARS